MDNFRKGARNALDMGEAPSMEAVDQAIFGVPGGSLAKLDEGRIVAKATPILLIWRDPKQPRRAIPSTISMNSNGDPVEVTPMLQQWHLIAEEAAGQPIDVLKLLNGEGEGLDTDKFPSVSQEIVKDFLELVGLALSIKAKPGLINPITIIESDGKLLIETGERRYLAYHLLHLFLGEEWAKIPASRGNPNNSAFVQAEENTKRRPLNPIGMARQLALLIMAVRGEETYRSYEEIVKAGGCDRRFYAQIADGIAHPTPRGMGERIQTAMGLGKEQLSQYRALLRLTDDEQINDAIWTRADVENWPEKAMREIAEIYRLTPVNLRTIIDQPDWTLNNLRALKEAPVSKPFDYPAPPAAQMVIPRRPVTSEWMHKTIVTKGNQYGKVVAVDGDWIIAILEPDNQRRKIHYTELTLIGDRPGPSPVVPAPQPRSTSSVPGFDHDFHIGDKVRTRTGTVGDVVGLSGRLISVKTANGTNSHDHTLLTKVTQSNFVPQISEDMIEEDVDPEAPQPTREWREGWAEDIAGSQIITDKVDSVEPTPEWRILNKDKADAQFMMAAINLALSRSDEFAADAIVEINSMTNLTAIQLGEIGVQPKLDFVYDTLGAYVASILQRVLDVAVS